MTKIIGNIIFLILASFASFSQSHLKGKVLNEDGDLPLEGASVYFNNTSIGTTTNAAGEFTLQLPGSINTELIVSSIGYEVLIYKIQPADNFQSRYVFKLKAKKVTMQNILVLGDGARKKYLRNFVDNFLGLTEEAASSSIKNLNSVYFTKPENDKRAFEAYSDTPLVIINKMLGYKIHFQLAYFYYNEATGNSSFYGYTRYEDLGDKRRWKKNRKNAYYGSTLHFFRSLINDKLKEESFEIYVVVEDTLKNIDSTKKTSMAMPVTAAQVIKKDTNSAGYPIYIATWKNKLMVQYNKNPSSKFYLLQHVFLNDQIHTGYRSYLILNEPQAVIDDSGILVDPLSIFFSGYWIYEKAANLLPYNYYPESEK